MYNWGITRRTQKDDKMNADEIQGQAHTVATSAQTTMKDLQQGRNRDAGRKALEYLAGRYEVLEAALEEHRGWNAIHAGDALREAQIALQDLEDVVDWVEYRDAPLPKS